MTTVNLHGNFAVLPCLSQLCIYCNFPWFPIFFNMLYHTYLGIKKLNYAFPCFYSTLLHFAMLLPWYTFVKVFTCIALWFINPITKSSTTYSAIPTHNTPGLCTPYSEPGVFPQLRQQPMNSLVNKEQWFTHHHHIYLRLGTAFLNYQPQQDGTDKTMNIIKYFLLVHSILSGAGRKFSVCYSRFSCSVFFLFCFL